MRDFIISHKYINQNNMIKMSRNILIAISLFILSACSSNVKDKYSSDFIDNKEAIFIPSELIKSDMLCRYPIRMEILDSIFVVQNLEGREYLQLYDHLGEHIKCLAKKGDAPMDISNLTDVFSVTPEGKIRAFFVNRIMEYDINKFLKEQSDYYQSIPIPKSALQYPVNSVSEHSGIFYSVGFTNNMRFSLASPDSLYDIYKDYPEVIDDKERNASVFTYACKTKFRPDYKYWVQGTYIGGTLEIFKQDDSNIKSVKQLFIYPSLFKDTGFSVTWGDDTTIGFDDIYVTQKHIYAILSGTKGSNLKHVPPKNPFSDTILIFDWEGNLVRKIKTNCMIMTIAIDTFEKNAYFISFNENGYDLRKINL